MWIIDKKSFLAIIWEKNWKIDKIKLKDRDHLTQKGIFAYSSKCEHKWDK